MGRPDAQGPREWGRGWPAIATGHLRDSDFVQKLTEKLLSQKLTGKPLRALSRGPVWSEPKGPISHSRSSVVGWQGGVQAMGQAGMVWPELGL